MDLGSIIRTKLLLEIELTNDEWGVLRDGMGICMDGVSDSSLKQYWCTY